MLLYLSKFSTALLRQLKNKISQHPKDSPQGAVLYSAKENGRVFSFLWGHIIE